MSERERSRLEAYRDGELSWLARWRVRRWLRRDPRAQRELEGLETLGTLLQDVDAEAPTPDLWPAIRLRLVAADVRAEAAAPEAAFGRRAMAYLALGAATASAAALALVLASEEPPALARSQGAVRWIDARGHPMLVLRDDPEATIIWVPDQAS